MMNPVPGMNPFLPFDTYIPDGEPKVFDGRLYLYGSYDRFGGKYCTNCYHVVSAPLDDLTSWTDHGVAFSSDDVPWSDALLYAPDALYFKGKYYLFFCMSDGSEGVAESSCPYGPFANARQICLNGEPIRGIDPSVLETDGCIYYSWGQFELQMGELEDDLCTLKPSSIHSGVLSNAPGREGFHEGSSLRRIGDHFCMIYASEYVEAYPNSGARPTKLDYAVGPFPYGPYERRGTVIDNDGCDPQTWNNHGSIVCANGEWYVFYHASSNATRYTRRARVERIVVDAENGVIQQAKPSSNGFLKEVKAEDLQSPVNACRFFEGAYVTQLPDGRFPCVVLKNGAGFAFSAALFEAGGYKLILRYRASKKVRLQAELNDTTVIDAPLLASEDWREAEFGFAAVQGYAALQLRFDDVEEGERCEVDAMRLIKEE